MDITFVDDDTSGAASALAGDSVRDEEAEKAEDLRQDNILETARKRLEIAEEAEREIRSQALDDLEFLAGKQWNDLDLAERKVDRRPCLTVNTLPQKVQQVTNEQRQNRPTIKIHPLDNAASEETAEVIQGIVRHIQYVSNAESARDTAHEAAARASFGYYRITTGYVSPDSFDQEIYVKRIRNQFSVFLDPFAQEVDASDANWGFIIDDMSHEDYRAQFPNSELASLDTLQHLGNSFPDWVTKDGIRIAEYFYKEFQDATIYQLSTGETVKEENLMQRFAQAQEAGIQVSVKNKRQTKVPIVKWCKINATEILEETIWPGQYIPIIPVYGTEYYIDGKRVLEGIVRNAKDPQRMLNYWKSAQTEAIALAPRAPFIGVEGQFEGHEEEWKTANRKNHAFLEYKAISLNGQPAPPPQRAAMEPAVQAITQAAELAGEDIKITTGVYDATVGNTGPEVSGIAIKRRNNQVQTANYHLTDNLTRAIKFEGRILVDLIPKIYDAPRAARIIGDDGTHKVVMLNQEHQDPDTGKTVLYDMTVGRYDVTVDTGPSYASKREEAAASMMDFARAVPQVGQQAPDIIARNMDWPGSQELAERLAKALPPALQDNPKNQQIPPMIQAQMAQMGQLLDQMKKELDESTKVIETKKLELEHKERIELMRQQFDVAKLEAQIGSKEALALLAHQVAEINKRLPLLNVNAPIGAPQDFDPLQADGGNFAGMGHIGGGANIPGGETPAIPTGGNSPGQTPGANP